jgi:hypothetical protein
MQYELDIVYEIILGNEMQYELDIVYKINNLRESLKYGDTRTYNVRASH